MLYDRRWDKKLKTLQSDALPTTLEQLVLWVAAKPSGQRIGFVDQGNIALGIRHNPAEQSRVLYALHGECGDPNDRESILARAQQV